MILVFAVLILNLHFHVFPYLIVSKLNYFLTPSWDFLFSTMDGWGQCLFVCNWESMRQRNGILVSSLYSPSLQAIESVGHLRSHLRDRRSLKFTCRMKETSALLVLCFAVSISIFRSVSCFWINMCELFGVSFLFHHSVTCWEDLDQEVLRLYTESWFSKADQLPNLMV